MIGLAKSRTRRAVGGSLARGFTLVELMITIFVAAILVTIAIPSFRNIILSNRLTTSANAIVDAINTARMDAIKLNAQTQFCSNNAAVNTTDTLGTACGTQAGAVYELPQSAASVGLLRAPNGVFDSTVQISGVVSAIRFSGQGFGYAPAAPGVPYNGGTVAVICTPSLTSGNRRVVSMNAGSIITTTTTTGTCP